ncbi:hypothetical protein MMPV_002868 [Pyropia vietnamensis]
MGRVVRGPVARRARAAALAASPRPGPGEAIMVVVGAPGAGLYALAPLGAGGAVPDGRDTAGAPTGDVTAATEAGGDGGSRGDQDVDNGVVAVAASDIEVSSSKVVVRSPSPAPPTPTPELYRLPRRLVGVVYIRPGRYVIARRYTGEDAGGGGKVAGEVVAALLDDHVEDLRRAGLWPTDTPGGGARRVWDGRRSVGGDGRRTDGCGGGTFEEGCRGRGVGAPDLGLWVRGV